MLNNSTNDQHLLLREKIRQQHLQNVLNTTTSIDNYYQSTSNNQLRQSQLNHHLQLFEQMQTKMTNVYNHLSSNTSNSFNHSHLNPFTTNTFKQTLKQSSIIIENDDLNDDDFQLQPNQLNSSTFNQQNLDKDLTHNRHQAVNNLVANSIGSSNSSVSLINTAAASSAAAVATMQSHHHSSASTLIDSVNIGTSTMNNSLNNRFLVNQCSSNNSASKLLLKQTTANGMSLGLGNGNHHSSNVLNNSNGSTMNMLGNMMISQQNNLNNSGTPSGLLSGGPLSAGSLSGSSSVSSNALGNGLSGKKHHVDKHSDEYKRRRERNNIAVRKSREKAKQRSRETEKKVNELYTENDTLKQKLSLMSKEIRSLRQLLAKYGVLPEVIDRELESILKNDELQQQLLHQQAQHQQLFNHHHHQNQQTAQQTANSTVAHQHLQQTTNLFHSMHHPSALTAHFSPHNHQTQHLSHY